MMRVGYKTRLTIGKGCNSCSRYSTKQVVVLLFTWLVGIMPVCALYISDDLEVLRIADVGATSKSVTTQNTYTDSIVICTYNLPSDTDNEAGVRVENVVSGGFDVRIQRPENSSSVTASDVYCLVSDEGEFALSDGRDFEAHTVTSDGTNGSARGWGVGGANGAENVSTAINGTYPVNSQPAVLGQVMTSNDDEFSAFWSFDCDNKGNVPFDNNINDGICIGKHVGQISGTTGDRADETLGYMVIEEGASPAGSFGGISYRVDIGADNVRGVGNSPPYVYALGSTYDFAVATQEAMDGGQRGWAVIYGTDPLASNNLDLAIEEETVAGDTSRGHTTEQVAYWAFRGVDHSDAPSSYGDASHNVSGILSIGPTSEGDADAESSAQNSTAADGDDDDQLDDEDGVSFRSPRGTGDSIFADVEITNNTGGTVNVCAWLDIPSGGTVDGDFDTTDGSCQTTSAISPTLTFQWMSMPADQGYTTYFRVRVSSATMGTADETGLLADGEVEDYRVIFDFTPTSVTIESIDLIVSSVDEFLAELHIVSMNDADLLGLLSAWDLQIADQLKGANRPVLLSALIEYLDPDGDGKLVLVMWSTLEERGTIGFFMERYQESDNNWVRVNNEMLPGLVIAPMGGEYMLVDLQIRAAGSYQYRLIELEANGNERIYGPYTLEYLEPE